MKSIIKSIFNQEDVTGISKYETESVVVYYNKPCPVCHNKEEDHDKLEENLFVCRECGHHFRISPYERVQTFADTGSFQEFHDEMSSKNPLLSEGYEEKITVARAKSRLSDAIVTGTCTVEGREIVTAIMSFQFMGGSMGSVVGEKISRAMEAGIEKNLPVVIFTASGGARMQEGIFSLMQMAKTSASAALMEEAGIPLFIVLTDPTSGGVTASYAMLGDVIIAEPKALVCFAGPRVIEGTINQKLPDGFQRSEFLQDRGFVDAVIERKDLRNRIAFLVDTHRKRGM